MICSRFYSPVLDLGTLCILRHHGLQQDATAGLCDSAVVIGKDSNVGQEQRDILAGGIVTHSLLCCTSVRGPEGILVASGQSEVPV